MTWRARLLALAAGTVLLMVLAIVVVQVVANSWTAPVWETDPEAGADRSRLFVLVHGMGGDREKTWAAARKELRKHGDVLAVNYPGYTISNADPETVAQAIAKAARDAHDKQQYQSIVLVGHSMGALIARKAYLYARGDAGPSTSMESWAGKVTRVVLTAGTNRGWSIRAQRPLDMGWGRHWQFWIGYWFGRLTGTGMLVRSMEAGAPFVGNLRLEWMRAFRSEAKPRPTVVQLLGDIDDVVSDEDNKDLRAASARFIWLRVRGTGHSDIVDFNDRRAEDGLQTLGEYRLAKFILAVTKPPEEVRAQNEEQAFQTDDDVTHVVFILHGIRDLGRWSAAFEPVLLTRFRASMQANPARKDAKLAIASVRYGFFGMGPFLFRPDRQRHVRWFMDVYTETLARYPKAERVDFIGHSNGTYLLADALKRYHSMRIDRVVFGGSVVRRDFDWDSIVGRGQVRVVRNYVAADDWVVALFPRLFEERALAFLRNDIGSAGFNGFDRTATAVENVKLLSGQHGAFRSRITEIVDFLMVPPGHGNVGASDVRPMGLGLCSLKFVSDWLIWGVWGLLLGAVIAGGWGVWTSFRFGGRVRLIGLFAYFVMVGFILYKV